MSHNIHEITAQLHAAGFRMTPQRQLILDAVCELGDHVAAEDVYTVVQRHTATLSLSTVYRTLHFLDEQGILRSTQTEEGRLLYEMAEDAVHHHHLICRICGNSLEIDHDALGQFYEQVAVDHGFLVDMEHISFYGVCRNCCSQTAPDH